jgi:hypothetical protein
MVPHHLVRHSDGQDDEQNIDKMQLPRSASSYRFAPVPFSLPPATPAGLKRPRKLMTSALLPLPSPPLPHTRSAACTAPLLPLPPNRSAACTAPLSSPQTLQSPRSTASDHLTNNVTSTPFAPMTVLPPPPSEDNIDMMQQAPSTPCDSFAPSSSCTSAVDLWYKERIVKDAISTALYAVRCADASFQSQMFICLTLLVSCSCCSLVIVAADMTPMSKR